ncbi:MAG: serine/threonine protein kinase, partial [Microcoleus sp.]
VPASDLYGLGATLIGLITKQHPADLPQKDLQIEFEQFTQLSPGFTNWLKWMTHPSLESRPASAQIAKEVLEKPQEINKYSQTLRQGKTVSTFSLFWSAIGDSSFRGGLALGACAAIYGTFSNPGTGTIAGGYMGLLLGTVLGLGNGIIVGIVTRLWFFPLTNPKLHRRVLIAVSIVLCTLTSLVICPILFIHKGESANDYIIFVQAPSLIVGLSMGATSRYIARRYQKASGL